MGLLRACSSKCQMAPIDVLCTPCARVYVTRSTLEIIFLFVKLVETADLKSTIVLTINKPFVRANSKVTRY